MKELDKYKELLNERKKLDNIINENLRQRTEIDDMINDIVRNCSLKKLFHIEAYVLDCDNNENINDILDYILYRTDVRIVLASSENRDILWHDDIDLNKNDCTAETYRKYFI